MSINPIKHNFKGTLSVPGRTLIKTSQTEGHIYEALIPLDTDKITDISGNDKVTIISNKPSEFGLDRTPSKIKVHAGLNDILAAYTAAKDPGKFVILTNEVAPLPKGEITDEVQCY